MSIATFRKKMLSGAPLAGTFVKTPAYEIVEMLAKSKLDFICLDGEHAPFDRARLDMCLAIGKALDFPIVVRVPSASQENILQALDSGAAGIVAPHIYTVEKAEELARLSRFGHHGRGFAGGTRWAGWGGTPMADLVQRSKDETIVIAQIEEPEAVDAVDEIAAVEGIDGLFVGPSDLSLAYGEFGPMSPPLVAAYETSGAACKAHGKAYMTFVRNAEEAAKLAEFGVTMFFIGSELGWMAQAANADADGVHAL